MITFFIFIDILLANNVEGILASVSWGTRDLGHFRNVVDSNIPLVFYDRVPRDIKADMVLLDDIDGAYMATKHLIDIGRKNIAICTGKKDMLLSINRLKGYRKALEENNIPENPEYIISGQSPGEAEERTKELLRLKIPPDGIFAISDLTLSGVMKAIYDSNFKIPENVAVIGFSEEPFRSMYNPQVSSILPMSYEIGKTAAEKLFANINRKTEPAREPETIYIKSRLEISSSTVRIS